MHDQASGDCRALKAKLQELCEEAGRPDTLVRIACRELEAWFLGDPEGLASALENDALRKTLNKQKYRDPDQLHKQSLELKALVPSYSKTKGAPAMASSLEPSRCLSTSFQAFYKGVLGLCEAKS